MATLFIMIGVSGSGKTTQATKIFNELTALKNQVVIVSSDGIRVEICENVNDQSKNKQVFEIAYQRIEAALAQGINVIFDATNLSREDRVRPIAIGRKYAASLVAIQLTTPLTVSIERNRSRDRVVPTTVIWKQHGKYFPPTKQEFDTIMSVGLDRTTIY